MKTTLTAVLLLAAGLAAAQAPSAGSDPKAAPAAGSPGTPGQAASDSGKAAVQKARADQHKQIEDIRAQERAQAQAIREDATLSKEDKDAALRKMRADFRSKRNAMRERLRAEREAENGNVPPTRSAKPQARPAAQAPKSSGN